MDLEEDTSPATPVAESGQRGTRQGRAPILEMCERFVSRVEAPFYTPGHKGGRSIPPELSRSLVSLDICCLPDTDTLSCSAGPIREAEQLLAEAYGVEQSFLLVNGSTVGNLASLVATVRPGEEVLVQRNSHRSVLAGLVHCGARPVWINPRIDPVLGIAHGLPVSAVEAAFARHPRARAICVLNPTYFGTTSDLGALVALAHQHGALVLVDEAHGPHLHFHPDLPISAEDVGADVVVQSTHKILSGFSQGAVLHLGSARVDAGRIRSALGMLQTTSPHYAILSSIDVARRQMALEGRARLEQLLRWTRNARAALSRIPGVQLLDRPATEIDGFHALDETKVTLDINGLRASGYEVQRRLNRLGVQPELAGPAHLLCVVTLGTIKADLDKLVAAVGAVAVEVGPSRRHPGESRRPSSRLRDLIEDVLCTGRTIAMTPRDAFFAHTVAISRDQAEGRISAETVTPYPPGIPVVMPGEVLDRAVLAMLKATIGAGARVSAADPNLDTFQVVA